MRPCRVLVGFVFAACWAQAVPAQDHVVPEILPHAPTLIDCPPDCRPARASNQKIVVELSKPEVVVVSAPASSCAPAQPAAKCDSCDHDKCQRGRFINIQCTKIRNKFGGHGQPFQQEIAIPAMATAMIPITLQGTQVMRSASELGLVRRSATEFSRRDVEEIAREIAQQLRPTAAAETAVQANACQNLEKRIQDLEGRLGKLEQQMERVVKLLP